MLDISQIKSMFLLDKDHSGTWREQAVDDFDFYAGRQWDKKDEAYLKDNKRPLITFNRSQVIINAVAGNEIQNRHEVKYYPVEMGDAAPNEVLTNAAKWWRDQSDTEDVESEAFTDNLICGMGWTETTLNFDQNDAGDPDANHLDPVMMWWDCNARKKNLSDATRVWRAKPMTIEDARKMFPDVPDTSLSASWAHIDSAGDGEPHDQEASNNYEGLNDYDEGADPNKMVIILHLQIKEYRTMHKITTPQTGEVQWLSTADFDKLTSRLAQMGEPAPPSDEAEKLVYHQYWVGSDIITDAPLPVDRFTYQAMTGYRDHNKGTWFGMIAVMRDPQMWANKWLSQSMNIMNTVSKGGVVMEHGAVEDEAKFAATWAKQDAVTFVNPGGLGKFQEKPMGKVPSQLFGLTDFAINAIREVTGVNAEMLGSRGAIQAMGLEQERKQSGMTILAPIFDALRKYRGTQGAIILDFIQRHLNDGRLIRVVGNSGAKYVELALQQDAKFDIVIDEAPSSPHVKERTWNFLAQMDIKSFPPQITAALLKYSPLPMSVVEELQQLLSQMGQPDPMAQQAQQLDMQKTQADIGMTVASTQKAQAQAEQTNMETRLDPVKLLFDQAKGATDGRPRPN